jgi:hypothetical protein
LIGTGKNEVRDYQSSMDNPLLRRQGLAAINLSYACDMKIKGMLDA